MASPIVRVATDPRSGDEPDMYPVDSRASSTLCIASGPTTLVRLITWETVVTDTPAAAATSDIVTVRRLLRPVTATSLAIGLRMRRNRRPGVVPVETVEAGSST